MAANAYLQSISSNSRSITPAGALGFEGHRDSAQWMGEQEFPCVELERRGLRIECLRIADLPVGKISGIADNGVAEFPEVDADLVSPAGS